MAKFNKKEKTPRAYSHEGAMQYAKEPVEEWFNFMFSSYLEPAFYESAETQEDRFRQLTETVISELSPEFVAKTAVFTRDVLGLRSVSHLVAAILNNYQFVDKRSFFRNVCLRPDDMAEIFGAVEALGDKRSHAAVRGFADYLGTLSPYQIAKYKMKGHSFNMADLINICHPKPTKAIQAFKEGTLETADTWESSISATGGDQESKAKEWIRLVEEHRLGYLALLRNLRNIIEVAPSRQWVQKYLLPSIADATAIKKSRIYPYQIYSAFKAIDTISNRMLQVALEDAFTLACRNIVPLTGKTLVILDVSGSMDSPISARSEISLKECGAVFATMFKVAGNDIDFIKFGNYAKYLNLDQTAAIYTPFGMVQDMVNNDNCGYGTDVSEAFRLVCQPYDRILLISDMQCMSPNSHAFFWGNETDGITSYRNYCRVFGPTHIYSFDLGNYHSQTENPNNPYVHLCTTLNDKVFELMQYIENEGDLVSYIEQNCSYNR